MHKVCAAALLLLAVCVAGGDVTAYRRALMSGPSGGGDSGASSTSVVHANIEVEDGTVVAKGAASAKVNPLNLRSLTRCKTRRSRLSPQAEVHSSRCLPRSSAP